jgi:hypothetical protein
MSEPNEFGWFSNTRVVDEFPVPPRNEWGFWRNTGLANDGNGGSALHPYVAAVLADNPLGYWRLTEPDGLTAADSSGHNNNGTLTGELPRAAHPFIAGLSAFAFTGSLGVSGPWIDLPQSFVIREVQWDGSTTPIPSLTIEYWRTDMDWTLLMPGTWTSNVIFSSGSGTGNSGLFVEDFRSSLAQRIRMQNGGSSNQLVMNENLVAPLVIGQWRHIVLTARAVGIGSLTTAQAAWINGVRLHTAQGTMLWLVGIGGRIGNGLVPSDGWTAANSICEVAYYDYELSPEQIAAHYQAARP